MPCPFTNLFCLSLQVMRIIVSALHCHLVIELHFSRYKVSCFTPILCSVITKSFRFFSFQTAMRVWDVLFNEGAKVLFHVALAIFKVMLISSWANKKFLFIYYDTHLASGLFFFFFGPSIYTRKTLIKLHIVLDSTIRIFALCYV